MALKFASHLLANICKNPNKDTLRGGHMNILRICGISVHIHLTLAEVVPDWEWTATVKAPPISNLCVEFDKEICPVGTVKS